MYTKYNWRGFALEKVGWYACGLILGFLASLLGIGGGPINVSLLMLLFAMPIKEATISIHLYDFFLTAGKNFDDRFSTGFGAYDLQILWFVIPAAMEDY